MDSGLALRAPRNDGSIVASSRSDRMSPPTAEDIVRRATAASMPGKPDEARKLCEQGLRRAARRSHAQPSAGRGAVFQRRNSGRPRHIEASLAKRPGQRRRAAARGAHRARGRRFRRARWRISIARSRWRRNAKRFWKKRGRWIRPASAAGARGLARHPRRSFRSTRRPPPGSDGWPGKMAIMPRPSAARTRRRRASARLGLVRSRPRAAGSARLSPAPPPPIARRSRSSPTMPRPRSISASCCRKRRHRQRDARLCAGLSAAPARLRHHRDGADIGARTAGSGSTRRRCAAHSTV